MRFLFPLIAGWIVGLACTAPASALDIDPARTTSVMVTRDAMHYHQSSKEAGWEEVAAANNTGWSAPRADTVDNFAPDHAQWLRIPVSNPSDVRGEYRLEIRWPFTESLQMRMLRREGFGPLLGTGSASAQDPLRTINKNVGFPFELAPGETASIYLRIVDPYFQYLPMFVWTADDYHRHAETRLILLSIAVGVLAVMVLYNAFLFLFTRDRMYLAYTNTVFSTLFLALAFSGLGQRLIWSEFDWLADNAYPIAASYAFFSVTLFFRLFVGLKQHGGWVLKANNFILCVWLVSLVANLIGLHGVGMGIAGLFGPFMTAVGMISVVYVWRRGNVTAKYFVIAWTPVTLSTTYSILPFSPWRLIWRCWTME
ncbi:hypothetical protein F6455_11905 [Proteobacteria bacterium 005FR1]|nr:hypothetical protein [Proteobacteria bacterium 005FR1]